jgi:L-lactate dehydrogenase complex protein LldG
MSGRDDIMASIRAHAPRLERPEPSIPLFDDAAPKNLLEPSAKRWSGWAVSC